MLETGSQNRLVIAHNPHSSRAKLVESKVFARLDAAGIAYVKIEVHKASLADNVARLKTQIRAGDVILCAAGDGSAHAVAHSVLAAGQPGVQLGFLAFGNFNDLPHAYNTRDTLQDPIQFLKKARGVAVRPIDIFADGEYLRSALLYATLGWTAQAASRFDDPKFRGRDGGKGVLPSLWNLGLFYFQSRRDSQLPEFRFDGLEPQKASDVLFVNGPTVARLFKSGVRYDQENEFLFRALDVSSLAKNIGFLASGMSGVMRGTRASEAVLNFTVPSDMPLQCDGEVVELGQILKLEVRKSARTLNILTTLAK